MKFCSTSGPSLSLNEQAIADRMFERIKYRIFTYIHVAGHLLHMYGVCECRYTKCNGLPVIRRENLQVPSFPARMRKMQARSSAMTACI